LFSFQYYIYRVYHARVYLKVSFKDDKGIYQRSNINGFVLSFFLFRANCLGGVFIKGQT